MVGDKVRVSIQLEGRNPRELYNLKIENLAATEQENAKRSIYKYTKSTNCITNSYTHSYKFTRKSESKWI